MIKNILAVVGVLCLVGGVDTTVAVTVIPVQPVVLVAGLDTVADIAAAVAGKANAADLVNIYDNLLRAGVRIVEQFSYDSATGVPVMIPTTSKIVQILEKIDANNSMHGRILALGPNITPRDAAFCKECVSRTVKDLIDTIRERKGGKLDALRAVTDDSSTALIELGKLMAMFVGLKPAGLLNANGDLDVTAIGRADTLSAERMAKLDTAGFNFANFNAALFNIMNDINNIQLSSKDPVNGGDTLDSAGKLATNIDGLRVLLEKVAREIVQRAALAHKINSEQVAAYIVSASVGLIEKGYDIQKNTYPHRGFDFFDKDYLLAKLVSDLTDDGAISLADINEFIREFNTRLKELYNDSHGPAATKQWPDCYVSSVRDGKGNLIKVPPVNGFKDFELSSATAQMDVAGMLK